MKIPKSVLRIPQLIHYNLLLKGTYVGGFFVSSPNYHVLDTSKNLYISLLQILLIFQEAS